MPQPAMEPTQKLLPGLRTKGAGSLFSYCCCPAAADECTGRRDRMDPFVSLALGQSRRAAGASGKEVNDPL